MITSEFFSFFEDLKQHNNREWFAAHKARYEEVVKKPLLLIANELISGFSPLNPAFRQKPEDCLFRINRDVRFSSNKDPYKLHASILLAPGGKKSIFPGFYVHLSLDECSLGCGSYHLDKNTLSLVRNEILYQTESWRSIVQDSDFKHFWGEVQGEKNKKLPQEFSAYANEVPELYHKSFYFTHPLTRTEVMSVDFVSHLISGFKLSWPLTLFLTHSLLESYEK